MKIKEIIVSRLITFTLTWSRFWRQTIDYRRAHAAGHRNRTSRMEIKRERKGWQRKGSTMRAVYIPSSPQGKVMESGKPDAGRKDCSTGAARQTNGLRKKENRLEPCSSIWPGQIRREHAGIYQAPQHRCITWMAQWSGSHLPIVCSLRLSLTSRLYHSFVCPYTTAFHPRLISPKPPGWSCWIFLVSGR